jgi:hypothetical protein
MKTNIKNLISLIGAFDITMALKLHDNSKESEILSKSI